MKTSAIGAILAIIGLIVVIVSFTSIGSLKSYDLDFMQKYSIILVSIMIGWGAMIIGAGMFLSGLKKKKVKE